MPLIPGGGLPVDEPGRIASAILAQARKIVPSGAAGTLLTA